MASDEGRSVPHIARSRAGVDEQGFRGPQVCKIVGITYRQLDYWARTGLLRPSISGRSWERHPALLLVP